MGDNHHKDCPKHKSYSYTPEVTVPRRVTCPTCKGLGTVIEDTTARFPDVQS